MWIFIISQDYQNIKEIQSHKNIINNVPVYFVIQHVCKNIG